MNDNYLKQFILIGGIAIAFSTITTGLTAQTLVAQATATANPPVTSHLSRWQTNKGL